MPVKLRISPAPSSPLLSRAQAAAYLGLARQTLDEWASTHRYGLKFFKIGRLAKYRKEDLDQWIEGRARGVMEAIEA